ncbi:MAG: hypothetical protein U5R31_13390 [Acidimicrobiia bacterium]|nr:hypothetical protein [Acidimicrobiia bacterium]
MLLLLVSLTGCGSSSGGTEEREATTEDHEEFCAQVDSLIAAREEAAEVAQHLAAARADVGPDLEDAIARAEDFTPKLVGAYDRVAGAAPARIADTAMEMSENAAASWEELLEAPDDSGEQSVEARRAEYQKAERSEAKLLEISETTWELCRTVLVGPAGPRPDTTAGSGWNPETLAEFVELCSDGRGAVIDDHGWGDQYCTCLGAGLRQVTSFDDAMWSHEASGLQLSEGPRRTPDEYMEIADGCLDEADFLAPRDGGEPTSLTVGDVERDLLEASESPLSWDSSAGSAEVRCVANGLVDSVGVDVLSRVGFSGATATFGRDDPDSESEFEQFLNARFPPSDPVQSFYDVLLGCIDAGPTVVGLPEPLSEEEACFTNMVLADPEVRLLYLYSGPALYGHHPPLAFGTAEPNDEMALWVDKSMEYAAECDFEG